MMRKAPSYVGGADHVTTGHAVAGQDPFSLRPLPLPSGRSQSWRDAVAMQQQRLALAQGPHVPTSSPGPLLVGSSARAGLAAAGGRLGGMHSSSGLPQLGGIPEVPPLGHPPPAGALREVPESFWRTVAPDVHQASLACAACGSTCCSAAAARIVQLHTLRWLTLV
jgi:hypothetical protein